MILFFQEDIKFNLERKNLIKGWLKEIASAGGYEIGSLNYIFCSDDYLLDINRQFLGHDYYTDIITFDNTEDDPKGRISGDIYISIDTVRANGETYGEGFERELFRVIAHGLLHLTGYDDVTDELQAEMTKAENRSLEMLYDRL